MRKYLIAAAIVAGVATNAGATKIAAGSASIGFTTDFTVDTAVTPGIFSATDAGVTVSNSTGGFATPNTAPFHFAFGTFDGTISFSKIAGGSIDETLSNLLTFGNISFTATKVTTVSYVVNPGTSIVGALYLLGYASEAGMEDTATSLTLSFNNNGDSAFSASATLSTPPSPPTTSVPEAATWAMMLVGFGAMGAAMRRRNVNLTFA